MMILWIDYWIDIIIIIYYIYFFYQQTFFYLNDPAVSKQHTVAKT